MAFLGSAFVVINSTTALSVVLGIGGGGPRQVTTQSLPAFRGSHTREGQGDSESSAHEDAVARVFSAPFPAMWGVESDSMATAPSCHPPLQAISSQRNYIPVDPGTSPGPSTVPGT